MTLVSASLYCGPVELCSVSEIRRGYEPATSASFSLASINERRLEILLADSNPSSSFLRWVIKQTCCSFTTSGHAEGVIINQQLPEIANPRVNSQASGVDGRGKLAGGRDVPVRAVQ